MLHSRSNILSLTLTSFPQAIAAQCGFYWRFPKMPSFPIRTAGLFPALVLMAAALAGPSCGSAQTAVAPAVHIDAAKLPDIEGIHLGMSVEQAAAIMKSLFPAGTHTLTVTAAKFMRTSDKPWLSSMTGMLATGCAGCQDQLDIRFSLPPNPQQVVAMHRGMVLGPSQQPLAETVVTSLRQKYGQETLRTTAPPSSSLTWLFNEQGQLQPPTTPRFTPGCAGTVLDPSAGGTSLAGASAMGAVLPTTPITPSVIATIMRDPCRSNVYVRADLGATGPGFSLMHLVNIYVSENDLDTRDVIAAQQYLDGVSAAEKQRELKNAQQQAAPTL